MLALLRLLFMMSKMIWQATQLEKEKPWVYEPPAPHTTLVVEKVFFPKLRSKPESEVGILSQVGQVLPNLELSITSFLKRLEYQGPLRAEPQRFYYVPKQTRGQWLKKDFLRSLLEAQKNGNHALSNINQWLADSQFKVRLEINTLDHKETLYELLLIPTETRTPRLSNIREVGFGISQVLPVVAMTLLASENSTLLLEQPELHLHPGVQAQLTDLLIRVADHYKVRLLIETHSEHLLLRFQRRIAETSIDALKKESHARNQGYWLQHTDFGLVFVSRADTHSTVEFINVDHRGQLINPSQEFRTFFSDDYEDVMQLTHTTAEIMNMESQA